MPDVDTKLLERLEREGHQERIDSYHQARAQADRLEARKDRGEDSDGTAAIRKATSVWALPSPVPTEDTYVCPRCGAAALTPGTCPGTEDDPHHAIERVLITDAL